MNSKQVYVCTFQRGDQVCHVWADAEHDRFVGHVEENGERVFSVVNTALGGVKTTFEAGEQEE